MNNDWKPLELGNFPDDLIDYSKPTNEQELIEVEYRKGIGWSKSCAIWNSVVSNIKYRDLQYRYCLKPKKRTEFKVGDRVWDIRFGWGEVHRIDSDCSPIVVYFDDDREDSYTVNGEFNKNQRRTLFFQEIPIPESALYTIDKPEPEQVPELTMEEVQEKLGFEFKLVKGE